MRPITLDFETEAIEDRPNYPPKPVGLAVFDPEGEFGEGYIVEKFVMERFLKDIWQSDREVLFHNAKFDEEVALEHFGLSFLPWERCHDTLFQLFLADPHALSLSLKPASEAWLGWPPEEQDAVKLWLEQNHIVRRGDKGWGAHIARAPAGLVGIYAMGDVYRTAALDDLIRKQFDEGMLDAYNRERRLMPWLVENERTGMRVDVEVLRHDISVYQNALALVTEWLGARLGRPGINLDADSDVANALRNSGVVSAFVKTKTGRDSVSKKNLTANMFNDSQVFEALGYRNRLAVALSMSMLPWLEMAERNNGYIYTSWNQVRQAHGNDGAKGTRTGRLSCSRFQNITKDWHDKGDYVFPSWLGVPELPLVRRYILGDEAELFCHRDYRQQEFKILAHFEDGALAKAYRENADLDIHTWMAETIKNVASVEIERRPLKIINFMELYGGGTQKMAAAIGTDSITVDKIRRAKRYAFPGILRLTKEVQARGRAGEAIRTWGGRLYYREPDKIINGYPRDFSYKLLNYLIQGSAADCTKEAVIRFCEQTQHARFLVTVHDEINFSCAEEYVDEELELLKEIMANVTSYQGGFDVPMLSDAKTGYSWGDLEKHD